MEIKLRQMRIQATLDRTAQRPYLLEVRRLRGPAPRQRQSKNIPCEARRAWQKVWRFWRFLPSYNPKQQTNHLHHGSDVVSEYASAMVRCDRLVRNIRGLGGYPASQVLEQAVKSCLAYRDKGYPYEPRRGEVVADRPLRYLAGTEASLRKDHIKSSYTFVRSRLWR